MTIQHYHEGNRVTFCGLPIEEAVGPMNVTLYFSQVLDLFDQRDETCPQCVNVRSLKTLAEVIL
jgi:hypothetical protein